MTNNQTISSRWSSRLSFILASSAAAVGLGNIWKFPYVMGENGGGAFVLIYLLCILGIGIPIMIAEVIIAAGGVTPLGMQQSLLRKSQEKAHFGKALVGWVC